MQENEGRNLKDASLESRNLLGLIRGVGVCQGNVEIIRNLCAEYAIKAIPIRGRCFDGVMHEWNQVKLDGIWYDDDFTNYQTNLAQGNYDRCNLFLMGIDGDISYTRRVGYKPLTETQPVGRPFSVSDKKFILEYGRTRNQKKEQSILEDAVHTTEEQVRIGEINGQVQIIKNNQRVQAQEIDAEK